MKKLLLLAVILFCCAHSYAQNYIFFLHNKFIEEAGLGGVHPEYGRAEYQAIIDSFKAHGLIVISEVRAKNTNGNLYAKKVAGQVDSLLKKGVPPSHITVAGTSKGGYIAMYVSKLVKNDKINYVFVGCCGQESERDKDIEFYGSILSIYERSDMTTSCKNTASKQGSLVTHFKEVLLNTGLKHGFLYKPLPEWLTPTISWAKQQYAKVP